MNKYDLHTTGNESTNNLWNSVKNFSPFLKEHKWQIVIATSCAFLTACLNLIAPILIGYTVDNYIQKWQFQGVIVYGSIILTLYIGSFITNYFQTLLMGRVGQNVLYSLRSTIFAKLAKLPITFFDQNKSGDLISRINNDTDKLNQFFSQSLVQFVANIIMIVGGAIFVLSIHWKIGLVSLAPAVFLLLLTQLLSPWIKEKNVNNQNNLGNLSGEISESIDNFKVVVAFNRRDYFRKKFYEINTINYFSAISAGIANNTLNPLYTFAAGIAQLLVIAFGLTFITNGDFTAGLLISYLTYVNRIYDPLKQMASVWSSFQTAFASWDRIYPILILDSDLSQIPAGEKFPSSHLMEFRDVSFSYPSGKEVLHSVNFTFDRGKTYALVGPTGGGKTTTAALISRLYDPTHGVVLLDGRDIRSYSDEERTRKIGFILQEPFLFTGTVRDNIVYGNKEYSHFTHTELDAVIIDQWLESLLERFDGGIDMEITSTSSKLSLGQKQLIAFMRAVLRKPEIIILDEATANVDTITEKLLDNILKKLPKKTTLIIIAHRLNTIENADEIYFVNSGEIVKAGSMQNAVDMLLHNKRDS